MYYSTEKRIACNWWWSRSKKKAALSRFVNRVKVVQWWFRSIRFLFFSDWVVCVQFSFFVTNPSATKSSPFLLFVKTTMVIIIIPTREWWCDDDVDNGGYSQNHFRNNCEISKSNFRIAGHNAFKYLKYEQKYLSIQTTRVKYQPFPRRVFIVRNLLQSSDSPNEFMIKILSIAFFVCARNFCSRMQNGIWKMRLSCSNYKPFVPFRLNKMEI